MEEGPELIIAGLENVEDYPTWKAMVTAMSKDLCGSLDNLLLSILYHRACKEAGGEGSREQVLAKMLAIANDLTFWFSPEETD